MSVATRCRDSKNLSGRFVLFVVTSAHARAASFEILNIRLAVENTPAARIEF